MAPDRTREPAFFGGLFGAKTARNRLLRPTRVLRGQRVAYGPGENFQSINYQQFIALQLACDKHYLAYGYA